MVNWLWLAEVDSISQSECGQAWWQLNSVMKWSSIFKLFHPFLKDKFQTSQRFKCSKKFKLIPDKLSRHCTRLSAIKINLQTNCICTFLSCIGFDWPIESHDQAVFEWPIYLWPMIGHQVIWLSSNWIKLIVTWTWPHDSRLSIFTVPLTQRCVVNMELNCKHYYIIGIFVCWFELYNVQLYWIAFIKLYLWYLLSLSPKDVLWTWNWTVNITTLLEYLYADLNYIMCNFIGLHL